MEDRLQTRCMNSTLGEAPILMSLLAGHPALPYLWVLLCESGEVLQLIPPAKTLPSRNELHGQVYGHKHPPGAA